MPQSKQTPGVKANLKAYQEALGKPAPRRGQVVSMSIGAFHYYRQIHHLDVQGWNGGVLMVKKIVEEAKIEGVE